MGEPLAAWLVRGGKDGEREADALGQGLFIAGWPGLGDISGCSDRDELRLALRAAYPLSKKGSIDNWTGQLWRLLREIEVDDHVVMPLKRTRLIAIGRVSGEYRYRTECPPGFQHVRPVEWLHTDLPRDAVGPDLLPSLGSLLTIAGLRRFGAARRIAELAGSGVDPGSGVGDAVSGVPADAVSFLAAAVQSAPERPVRITVLQLLRLFGASRKSAGVSATIELALEENGLVSKPSIMQSDADDVVSLEPVVDDTSPVESEVADPVEERLIRLHVGRIRSATAGVVSVQLHDPLVKARTLMLTHNFSQLAVIEENGEFRGAVSWESIGQADMAERAAQVEDALMHARVVEHNEDLLNQIAEIYASGYVFVRGADRAISGIITAADLTQQFDGVVRPFVLLEEIEQRLHRTMGAVFAVEEIAAKASSRQRQQILDGQKPMLGLYQQVIKDEQMWRRLRWRLDHEAFLRLFNQVREMRNSLMHFSGGVLSDEELAPLHGLLRMLRVVDP
ncbi:CBS domain-containing protein [Lentzea californiensis]|uniref:CBS domain-containing protein n=1 Tax=Lentzea californiensis TaxID=438851 RepID=UPI002164E0E7|nr:CBS domain-containing protein [Lentzea californiensis]MCR3748455.1 restriction system protein [Lentzea californiensis]